MNFLLDESWQDIKEIAIYGFGKAAQGNIDSFIDQFNVINIIDNNKSYLGKDYRGVSIVNFDTWINDNCGEKIIIIAAEKALHSIKSTLCMAGKKEYIDFTDMDAFVNEWYWRFKGKICIGKVTTSVTTACTFNCQYCNMLMPYYKETKAYSCEMLCKDADMFFTLVDYVTSFVIIGGEPLIYKNLCSYLEYLGNRYGSRIANIQLITNGSILPSKELLNIVQKYNIEIRISDYTLTMPYESRLKKFVDMLENNQIKYIVFKQEEWLDFGFPHEKISMGETKEELREHMLNCHGMCHWLHNGKYYYCSSAWSANECGIFELQEGDYLRLDELVKTPLEGKEALLKFHIGELQHGYMSLCKYCRGFGDANNKTVKAGIQIKREGKSGK